jgi:3',5'-cyclic AMP phosphodiesterase CpdA
MRWTDNELQKGDAVIIHLSDLHVGASRWEDAWKLTSQFLRKIAGRADLAKLMLVSGDLADTPTEDLFRAAKEKLDAIGIEYFVCAGNHDRFLKGNRLQPLDRWLNVWAPWALVGGVVIASAILWLGWQSLGWMIAGSVIGVLNLVALVCWIRARRCMRRINAAMFKDEFGHRVLNQEQVVTHTLTSAGGTWKIGLLGLDSSKRADVSARGFVDPIDFEHLEDAIAKQVRDVGPMDLVVLLVHHHLLSIRKLEEKHRSAWERLLNLTTLINAGSLLERMSTSHIDLVLHGHEHANHWAQYRSCEANAGSVRIIGAGSATGNDSLHGANLDQISFNLYVLTSERSVQLLRVWREGGQWEYEQGPKLFNATDLRDGNLRRSLSTSRQPLLAEVIKHVHFFRNRDVRIRCILKEVPAPDEFRHRIYNSSGVPRINELYVIDESGHSHDLVSNLVPIAGEDHAFEIVAEMPGGKQDLVTIVLEYDWLQGGILTEEDLRSLKATLKQSHAGGHARNEGFEFAVLRLPFPAASAQLIVTLPDEFRPTQLPVVLVSGEESSDDLNRRLRCTFGGQYSLTVPFPQVGRAYEIRWKPPSQPLVYERTGRIGIDHLGPARQQEIVSDIAQLLRSDNRFRQGAISLYVGDPKDLTHLRLVASHSIEPGYEPPEKPPRQVTARGDLHVVAQAWWGQTILQARPSDNESAADRGFLHQERFVICLPVAFKADWVNPSPSCVLRIGIFRNVESTDAQTADFDQKCGQLLTRAILTALTHALS